MREIESFPLTWPVGWKRTLPRKRSKFQTTFSRARDQLFNELKLMGVRDWNVILSTNIPLRRDGLPYSGQANPDDPGVAIYFKHKERDMVFACDTYISVIDNLWAVCKTVEAIRGIQRWGASDMMERAFTGFQQISSPRSLNWWDVLKVPRSASLTDVKKARNDLVKVLHPDIGGEVEEIIKINAAWEQAIKEKK